MLKDRPSTGMVVELSARSKEVFRQIVDAYVATGEPVGSRTVARRLEEQVSPATIRNVMADLEEAGLLYAPHTSAGRVPTDAGLRLYVDGLLEIGNVTDEERREIEGRCSVNGRSIEASCPTPPTRSPPSRATPASWPRPPTSARSSTSSSCRSPGRALVIVVGDNGLVENRVIDVPLGMSAATLVEAGNYLTARLAGRSRRGAASILAEIEQHRSQLDTLTQKVVSAGLATWSGDDESRDGGFLIVRGHAKLLEDVTNLADLERIRGLFEMLETRQSILRLVELTQSARACRSSSAARTSCSGCPAARWSWHPYSAAEGGRGASVVGAIGVIGPTRMNYARIIPMVDYTARVVSRLLGTPDTETRR